MKQFLLNPDGSLPPNTNMEVLQAEGIVMVLPTQRYTPGEWMTLVEGEPVQTADGVWHQVWNEVPAPPPEPVPVPESVSRFQARAALLMAGHLEAVEAMMQSPDTPAIAKLAWQDAQEFRRTSPTVLAMGAALGLNDAALDALFIKARGIEA